MIQRSGRGCSRRFFLRSAGGVALALPWLEKLHGVARAQEVNGPRRVIVVSYSMGIPLGEWVPRGSATGFTLPYVTAPLEPFRDRCLFVSSIDNTVLRNGGNGFVFGHPAKKESCLTGTLTTDAFSAGNQNDVSELLGDVQPTDGAAANGPSVEHVVGQFLRAGHPRGSVDLAVYGDALYDTPQPTGTSHFFFESAGNPVTLSQHPRTAFDGLFAGLNLGDTGPSPQDVARQRANLRNKSVLDAVRASFRELQQGLGRADRTRLQEHADRIRQLELDMPLPPAATCSLPSGIDAGVTYAGMHMGELAGLQNRVLAHAMACGLAPVGRIEYVRQQNPRFGIASLDSTLDSASNYDWHAMVHGDPLPGTSAFLRPLRDDVRTDYDSRLLDGYRFFVQQFADLLALLDGIPEGPESSVLDHSLVVLASDLGEGSGHGHMKMGYVLAGNLGGARNGYHLDAGPAGRPYEPTGSYFYDASRFNVNQLLNSILDMAGVQDGSGAPVTMGLQGWLEQEGLPRRIDALFG